MNNCNVVYSSKGGGIYVDLFAYLRQIILFFIPGGFVSGCTVGLLLVASLFRPYNFLSVTVIANFICNESNMEQSIFIAIR